MHRQFSVIVHHGRFGSGRQSHLTHLTCLVKKRFGPYWWKAHRNGKCVGLTQFLGDPAHSFELPASGEEVLLQRGYTLIVTLNHILKLFSCFAEVPHPYVCLVM